jgi:hypothetical protein
MKIVFKVTIDNGTPLTEKDKSRIREHLEDDFYWYTVVDVDFAEDTSKE